MPYFEKAELNPDFNPDEKCSSESCKKTSKEIAKHQAIFQCINCKKCFHPICKSIVGVHIAAFASDPNWTCSKTCKQMWQADSESTSLGFGERTTLENKLDQLEKKLNQFFAEFSGIKEFLSDLRKSQEFISSKFDELKLQNDEIMEKNKKLNDEVSNIKKEYTTISSRVNELEANADIINQEKLKSNIIIAGLPSTAMTAITVVTNIFSTLSSEVNMVESAIYLEEKRSNILQGNSKLQGKPDVKIMVQFKTVDAKYELLNKKSKYKWMAAGEIGFTEENVKDAPVFLREHLTKFQQNLYYEAQQIKKKFNFKYLWVKQGTILLRKNDESRVFRIISRNDIIKLELSCQSVE